MKDENKSRDILLIEIKQLREQVAEMVDDRRVRGDECKTVTPNESDFQLDAHAFNSMYKNHNAMMYVVDLETFFIVDANNAALKFYGHDLETFKTKRVPDLNTAPEEEIRAEIKRAIAEGRDYYLYQHRLANDDVRDVEIHAYPLMIHGKHYSFAIVHDITEHKKVEDERKELIVNLQSALDEIKSLQGIIPICSSCKMIRDDKGYWNQVEDYFGKHTDVDFSHSLCPNCLKEQFPDIADQVIEQMDKGK